MKTNYTLVLILAAAVTLTACRGKKQEDNSAVQAGAQSFLDKYNAEYQKLAYADNLGQWDLNTHIVEGDTMAQHKSSIASQALADYTGSVANIDSAKKYLALK